MCSARDLQFAPRSRRAGTVPAGLCGDWEREGVRFRFHPSGALSTIHSLGYVIDGDRLLSFGGGLPYQRRTGTTGLEGSWRCSFDSGEVLDLAFGPLGYFGSMWNGEPTGGGHYIDEAPVLTLVEQVASFACSGEAIAFSYPDGAGERGAFRLEGDTLVIASGPETGTYTRCDSAPRRKAQRCSPIFSQACAMLRSTGI